jgi:hypothetical protein
VGRAGRVTGAGPAFWWKGDGIWSFLAANQMLGQHYAIGMVTRRMAADSGVPVGAFLIDTRTGSRAAARVTASAARYGIDFTTTAATMAEASRLRAPSVRVAADPDTLWVLTQQMGFTGVASWSASTAAVPAGTTAVVSSSAGGPSVAAVQRWLQGSSVSATRTYIGFDRGADQSFAFGLLGSGVTSTADPAVADNGVVALDVTQSDVLTAFSPAHGYAFAYPPRWYTVTDPAVTAEADYAQGTAGPFQEGFWNNADQAAVGSAALISGSFGAATKSRVVLMGFHPTFRGFQDATAPILARAVLLSAAQPPTAP